jgi:hypothetical protein
MKNNVCKQYNIKRYYSINGNHKKYADPKHDLVFKLLFCSEKNKDLVMDFINNVLPNKKVHDIEFLRTSLEPEYVF